MDAAIIVGLVIGMVIFIIKQLNKTTENKPKYEEKKEHENRPLSRETLRNINENMGYSDTRNNKTQEDKDSFEGWFYESVPDYISYKKRLKIVYIDANGKRTERNIEVYNFSQEPYGGFFLARCELRNGNRTFRADRIQSCIDLDTGEYVTNVAKHLLQCYHQSDEYKKAIEKEEKRAKKREEDEKKAIEVREKKLQLYEENGYFSSLLNKYDALMKVIMYMVRCDGTFNQKEKAIVKEILQNLENNNVKLTDKCLERLYEKYPLPTIQTFRVNALKIIKEKTFKIDLLEVAENIVSTQKTVHKNEEELLEYLREKTKVSV